MSDKLFIPGAATTEGIPIPTRAECRQVLEVQLSAIPHMLAMGQFEKEFVLRNQKVFAHMLRNLAQIKCAGE